MKMRHIIITTIALSCLFLQSAKGQGKFKSIHSGVPWFDQNDQVVSAHGAGIVWEDGRFYLFGEYKSDIDNAFTGFSCYSSCDLCNWKFEGLALTVQESGRLGPGRVGERPKVMKCPATGEYVMYMHTDDLRYKDPAVGYAASDKITGPYFFQGPVLYEGDVIRKWDMGVFQDTDGTGYLMTHSGNLYLLSRDYKSITRQIVKNMTSKCESPVIFKKDDLYYWMGSDLTGWERNDNYYFTAASLSGPWIARGNFAPKGTLTWNSQSTFVLPITGSKTTTVMYMGDRWSHPRQYSAAVYVWQPLEINGNSVSLKDFHQSWEINTLTGEWTPTGMEGEIVENTSKIIVFKGQWRHSALKEEFSDSRSEEKGASCSVTFTGTQIGLVGTARPDGGYAQVILKDSEGKTIISCTIDMYCQYTETSMKFLSPVLRKGTYTLNVSVIGEHWYWVEKSGRESGSSGNFISVDKFVIQD